MSLWSSIRIIARNEESAKSLKSCIEPMAGHATWNGLNISRCEVRQKGNIVRFNITGQPNLLLNAVRTDRRIQKIGFWEGVTCDNIPNNSQPNFREEILYELQNHPAAA
jgi:hypothetical protein